jgi:hypothetical protein
MTGWLQYFTEGFGAQTRDVQMTAEHVMRKDVILARARKNGLKERSLALLYYLPTAGEATGHSVKDLADERESRYPARSELACRHRPGRNGFLTQGPPKEPPVASLASKRMHEN